MAGGMNYLRQLIKLMYPESVYQVRQATLGNTKKIIITMKNVKKCNDIFLIGAHLVHIDYMDMDHWWDMSEIMKLYDTLYTYLRIYVCTCVRMYTCACTKPNVPCVR
jgi:homoserine trans-succinylase